MSQKNTRMYLNNIGKKPTVKNFKEILEMTDLKEIHLRLDEETKAQWLELVETMGEKMQSRAFRRIIQNEYGKIELESDGKTGD